MQHALRVRKRTRTPGPSCADETCGTEHYITLIEPGVYTLTVRTPQDTLFGESTRSPKSHMCAHRKSLSTLQNHPLSRACHVKWGLASKNARAPSKTTQNPARVDLCGAAVADGARASLRGRNAAVLEGHLEGHHSLHLRTPMFRVIFESVTETTQFDHNHNLNQNNWRN